MGMAKGDLTPEDEKKKAVEDSLEWLRSNDVSGDDVDSPTVKALSKLAGIPMPKKLTPENKKKTIDSAIEWLRNAESEDLPPVETPTLESLTSLTGVPMPGVSQVDKARALEEALDWLRKNDPDVNKVDNPGLKRLAKLSGEPMPKKLTPERKQKSLDDAMDWLRSNDVSDDD